MIPFVKGDRVQVLPTCEMQNLCVAGRVGVVEYSWTVAGGPRGRDQITTPRQYCIVHIESAPRENGLYTLAAIYLEAAP